MSTDLVKLKFIDALRSPTKDRNETLLCWPASSVPQDIEKFSIDPSTKTNKTAITATGCVNFCSMDKCDEEVNYFIATRDHRGKLVCHSAQLFRMFPDYGFKDDSEATNEENDLNRLTRREQWDELKEKFGSRRTQRDLASKRKYEIQFSSDDVDNLPTINARTSDIKEENIVEEDSVDIEPKTISTVLPPRNAAATSVSEVYSLTDIITEAEIEVIQLFEDSLMEGIKSDFIKNLIGKSKDSTERAIAIYSDLLLQLIKLSAYEMRKADPLPLVENDIKKLIFERYTSTMQSSARSLRYIITDQNKDRIYVNIFLLIFRLNNYKQIDLEKLQTVCKIPMNNIRRMLELIGCYIETMRNPNGTTVRVARFKLPLNPGKKEPKKKIRR